MLGALTTFDPSNLSKEKLRYLGDSIQEYLLLLEEVMVFPEELEGDKEQFQEAIKTTKKLVKKLRKGDRSVFKNLDEEGGEY